jgi:DNA-binding transcriptional ArsR family regulator
MIAAKVRACRRESDVTPQTGSHRQQGRQFPTATVVDDIFRALSDPTRRHVLERLSSSPASVSELAAPYKMALPSFIEHLRVLETSGLVHSHKVGRVRTYEIAPDRLKVVEDWLSRQRTLWERRLDQLDSYLMKMKKEGSE